MALSDAGSVFANMREHILASAISLLIIYIINMQYGSAFTWLDASPGYLQINVIRLNSQRPTQLKHLSSCMLTLKSALLIFIMVHRIRGSNTL